MIECVIKLQLCWYTNNEHPARFDGKQSNNEAAFPYYISYNILKAPKAIMGYVPTSSILYQNIKQFKNIVEDII